MYIIYIYYIRKNIDILKLYIFSYSLVSQSMAIETTAIGGRTVKVQKLVWTMIKKNV